jgi:hypothetical protein
MLGGQLDGLLDVHGPWTIDTVASDAKADCSQAGGARARSSSPSLALSARMGGNRLVTVISTGLFDVLVRDELVFKDT